jgi:hypothetical protein
MNRAEILATRGRASLEKACRIDQQDAAEFYIMGQKYLDSPSAHAAGQFWQDYYYKRAWQLLSKLLESPR